MLAPWIIEHFPEHRIYVEAFGGAASVLLQKPRSYGEVYNELDGEIVNLFRIARDRGEELRRALELTPFARDEFLLSYEASDDPVEQARRTVARSFMGFGSPAASGRKTGFRSNSNRSGTTPAHGWANLAGCFEAICARVAGVVIENKEAISVMEQQDAPETLHYVDPPYVHGTRHLDKGYRFELTDEQHAELADALHDLSGMVVLSGYPCALYDELFGDWERRERPALADGAQPRTEVLWLNPACSEALERRQPRMFA
jgi:DNA adenine methylase